VARIHKATHRHFLAELEFFDVSAHPIDRSHNLVAWDQRVVAATPVVFGEMQIGVTHATKSNIDGHIFGANTSTFYVMGDQVLVRGEGCKTGSGCQGSALIEWISCKKIIAITF
jgi:hypothetical protein